MEEQDNIYIYKDEDEENDSGLDDSGPNYSQVDDESLSATKEDTEEASATNGAGVNVFGLLLKVMLNPIEGWKSIRRRKLNADEVARACFYPLVACLALSQFSGWIYSVRVSLTKAIEDAVISFVSYFFGYFCIVLLIRIIMPKSVTKIMDAGFGKIFVLISLSSLCLFGILTELFPMLWAILIFLPLWTVYIICRGAKFFSFPDNRQISYTALLCFMIIGIPLLINLILELILPGVN